MRSEVICRANTLTLHLDYCSGLNDPQHTSGNTRVVLRLGDTIQCEHITTNGQLVIRRQFYVETLAPLNVGHRGAHSNTGQIQGGVQHDFEQGWGWDGELGGHTTYWRGKKAVKNY